MFALGNYGLSSFRAVLAVRKVVLVEIVSQSGSENQGMINKCLHDKLMIALIYGSFREKVKLLT